MMDIFPAPAADGTLFFDNLMTPGGVPVFYDREQRSFLTDGIACANREALGCNWAAPAAGALCPSCAMTLMAPDRHIAGTTEKWAETEAAKRWVLDNLGQWGWFRAGDLGPHPMFHMLAEGPTPVVMGHAEGVITITVEEADPVARAERREAMDERFRTMIGHMRHEIAHMLWWRLSLNPEFLDAFRALFGDERSDYGAALERHYGEGPPEDWQARYLTPYASAHPHEDWAETTAHLLHLVDIADSTRATGLALPVMPGEGWQPYGESDADRVVSVAAEIALAINHVNRSMGLQDLYPFVLSDPARAKLEFVHRWLRPGPG